MHHMMLWSCHMMSCAHQLFHERGWYDGTGLDDTIMEEDEDERLVSWVCGGKCVRGEEGSVWEMGRVSGRGGEEQENECC